MSQEWGDSMPRIPQRCGKPPGRCPIWGQESFEVELRTPIHPQVIQMVEYSSSRSVSKQLSTQGALKFHPGSLDRRASWGDALKEKWPKGLRYAFPPPNITQLVGQTSRMGRGSHHNHILLAKSELVPRDHASNTEPPRHFQPSQWFLWNVPTKEAIQKVMKSIQLTAWRLTSPSVPRMA